MNRRQRNTSNSCMDDIKSKRVNQGERKRVKSQTEILPLSSPINVPHNDHRFDGFDVALFSNCDEYTEPMCCEVVGQIPNWVTGSFIRVGPGKFEWGKTEAGHLFDGDAIAHKFDICDGKVMFSSKFLDTGKN